MTVGSATGLTTANSAGVTLDPVGFRNNLGHGLHVENTTHLRMFDTASVGNGVCGVRCRQMAHFETRGGSITQNSAPAGRALA